MPPTRSLEVPLRAQPRHPPASASTRHLSAAVTSGCHPIPARRHLAPSPPPAPVIFPPPTRSLEVPLPAQPRPPPASRSESAASPAPVPAGISLRARRLTPQISSLTASDKKNSTVLLTSTNHVMYYYDKALN